MSENDAWGHISVRQFTHCEQRGPCGAGLVWHALLPCEHVLEVLPHLFVEDHMEEEDEDSLWKTKATSYKPRSEKDVDWHAQTATLCYLQTAEASKQVVEGHHIAVDRH